MTEEDSSEISSTMKISGAIFPLLGLSLPPPSSGENVPPVGDNGSGLRMARKRSSFHTLLPFILPAAKMRPGIATLNRVAVASFPRPLFQGP